MRLQNRPKSKTLSNHPGGGVTCKDPDVWAFTLCAVHRAQVTPETGKNLGGGQVPISTPKQMFEK